MKSGMRVAALYDIHGNLPALEATLDEIRRLQVDQVVVGGDIVPGPMVRETLTRLLDLDVPVRFIYGNCETAMLGELAGRQSAGLPEQIRPIMRWAGEQLGSEYQALIAAWPKTLRVAIDGLGDVLFCHGTPRDENECFTRLTPERVLLPQFEPLGVPLVVCGHTHMQFDRLIGTTRVVNAGSIGMPFGVPGADWLLLGPDVRLQHTKYDLAEAADRIRHTVYPEAEHYAARYVLQPPSEAEMLEVFTKASVG